MLNTIKNMINTKKAYMEATELIMESDELDDSIVLDEAPVEPEIPKEEPNEEEPAAEPAPEETPAEDPMNSPLPIPGEEEIPQPANDTEDILTAEIDLTTNTQVDAIPVPPINAGDAVEDDLMGQSIEAEPEDQPNPPIEDAAGIMAEPIDEPGKENGEDLPTEAPEGGIMPADESTNIMAEAVDDDKEEKARKEAEEQFKNVASEEPKDDVMTEAISIDGEAAPTEGGEEPAPDTTAEGGEENPVTAAVKDKLEEISADNQEDNSGLNSKEELMKKLSNLTKSIEDAKALVMGSIK